LAIGDRGSLNEDGSFVIPGFRTRFGEMPPACRKKPEKNGLLLIFSFFFGESFYTQSRFSN
jgi:hypothetical protein